MLVDPAGMLADIGHLQQILVEASSLTGFAERRFVHVWGAGCYHHAGQSQLFDILLDELLP